MDPGTNYRQIVPARPGLEMMVNDSPRNEEQPIVRLLMGLAPLLQKPYDPKRMGSFLDAHMDDMPTSVYLALKRDPKMQRGLYDFASGMLKAEEGKYNAQRGYWSPGQPRKPPGPAYVN